MFKLPEIHKIEMEDKSLPIRNALRQAFEAGFSCGEIFGIDPRLANAESVPQDLDDLILQIRKSQALHKIV